MLPKFYVSEDWDFNSGNVDIYFDDDLSPELFKHVCSEIERLAPKLPKDERTSYHLERLVGGIFSNTAVKGKLLRNPESKQWVLAGMMRWQR